MKKTEWNEGLDHIDPDLVEDYVEQKERLENNRRNVKSIWLRVGAVAACCLLILSAVIAVPMLWEDDPGIHIPPNEDHVPNIFDATLSPEKFNGSNSEFIVGTSLTSSGVSGDPPKFQFSAEIAVKARVVKNYPDTYYKLDTRSEYRPTAFRVIEMETLEVMSGKNVPQYFLYLIPEYVYVDMSVYDSLLIGMSQIGFENYVLKNVTQNQMESFELLMFADYLNEPELGNIIAFRDGVFDESLWQNDTWIYGYQFAEFYLDHPEQSDLVVARGDSESTVIAAIKAQYDRQYAVHYEECSVVALNFTTQEAKEALEFVKPFVNGVFSQKYEDTRYYRGGRVIFTRYINGCQTEETVTIDLLTEKVTYSEIRYTKEDMAQMENISAHLSEKAAEYEKQLPIPPHTDPEGKKLLCLNLYAWYVKVDGKLYGVLKTAWRYQKEDDWCTQYYDDHYTLYDMSAGTATDIPRDILVTIIGTRNVYMGEYGNEIGMPI